MMSSSRAVPTTRQEDMHHPPSAFADPTFADAPLDELRLDYLADLRGRAQPTSATTVVKYDATLRSFFTSLARHGRPVTLGELTKPNIMVWVTDQRAAGLSEHTIAGRIAGIKAFAHKYLYRDNHITTIDLLGTVQKSVPQDAPRTGLTEAERENVLACFTDPTYYDTRDRALVAVFLATGLRFREVIELPLSSFDRLHGELVVVGKGGKVRTARLGQRALKYVREYLRERPRSDSDALWLTAYGQPLTYGGGHRIIDRIRRKSGVTRLHWHLFRHGFAQHALRAGAHQGLVQEMLGHATPAMTRRYLGQVKQQEAARQMPQYAPI